MRLLSKGPWMAVPERKEWRKREVSYRARFWDSERKRHYECDCTDVRYDKDGRASFLNTSTNVSYYSQLVRVTA